MRAGCELKTKKPKQVQLPKIACDSNCVDSLRNRIVDLLQPVETECFYDSVGTVNIQYFAEEGVFVCNWDLLPYKVITNTITETKTVIEPRPWWEIPTAVILTGITTYGIIEAVK